MSSYSWNKLSITVFIFLCPFGHNTCHQPITVISYGFSALFPPKLKLTQMLFRYVFIMPRFCFSKRCQGLTSLHGACMCIELYHSHFVKSLLLCSKQEGANSKKREKDNTQQFLVILSCMTWRSRWCNHICELLPVTYRELEVCEYYTLTIKTDCLNR